LNNEKKTGNMLCRPAQSFGNPLNHPLLWFNHNISSSFKYQQSRYPSVLNTLSFNQIARL